MNMTGEHVPLRVKRLFLVCVLVLSGTNPAFAQYLTATNWPDLAAKRLTAATAFTCRGQGQPMAGFLAGRRRAAWVCSDMLQICTNLSSTNLELHGMTVAVTPIRLTKDVLTGIALVQSTDTTNIIASISAPSGYYPECSPRIGRTVRVFRGHELPRLLGVIYHRHSVTYRHTYCKSC